MTQPLDYYQVLQVDRRADQKVIERVYKTLMFDLKAHPDLGGDEDLARNINAAYTTLRDPEKRKQYDADLSRRERMALAPRETAQPAGTELIVSMHRTVVFELEDPGPHYLARCPRCEAAQTIAHSLPFDERLQCLQCHWFFRDPQRELAALRARILRLDAPSRILAVRLYDRVHTHQRTAEEAAARGDETAARNALQQKRDSIRLLANELRWVRL